jgi:hypothetical protein
LSGLECRGHRAILEGMIRRKRMPRDTNQLAAEIVKLATGQPVEPEPDPDAGKNPHAVALGRLGGLKGGIARKTKLPKARRSEIARKAVQARWKKHRETKL